jgi:hypothetical protein
MVYSFGLRGPCAVALSLFMLVARPAHAGGPSEDAARKHFMAGVAYLQDQEGERYEEAYAEFKAAFDLSHSPKVLGNIGLCAMKLERDGEAIAAYTRYLAEVPDIDPDERAQIARDVETLNASASRLTMLVHQRGAVLYDTRFPVRGANISNVYTPVVGKVQYIVRPGHHVITLKIDGRDRAAWEVTAAAGAAVEHDFVIQDVPETAPPQPRAPLRIAPLVLTGVGVATLATGTVVGLVALGKVHDLEKTCPNDTCSQEAYPEVGRVRNWVRATDYLLLGGGVLTAGGIAWLLLPSSSSTAPTRGGERTNVGAICTVSGCYGTLRVGF